MAEEFGVDEVALAAVQEEMATTVDLLDLVLDSDG